METGLHILSALHLRQRSRVLRQPGHGLLQRPEGMEAAVDVPEPRPEGAPLPIYEPAALVAGFLAALDGVTQEQVRLVKDVINPLR